MFRVVFAGTPKFSVKALDMLYRKHTVLAVMTQPDRPKGRGKKVSPSPVKLWAESKGVEVLQPERLSADVVSYIHSLKPDFLVIAAYGLILPQSLLDVPTKAPINIHPSLLPKWRGASPIQHSLLKGEKQTGVSIMKMVKALDAGPCYYQKTFPIGDAVGAKQLTNQLAELGTDALDHVLTHWGSCKETAQLPGETYAVKITKEMAVINWNESADKVVNCINAFDLMPVARTCWNGDLVRVGSARIGGDQEKTGAAGSVVSVTSSGLIVQCGQGFCEVLTIQLPNRRMMSVKDALNGHPSLAKACFNAV